MPRLRGVVLGGLLVAGWPATARGEEAVTVRGTRLAAGARDEAAASSQIRGSALEGAGVSTPDVLRRETGVNVTETGGYGALSTAAIRGATAAQTSVSSQAFGSTTIPRATPISRAFRSG